MIVADKLLRGGSIGEFKLHIMRASRRVVRGNAGFFKFTVVTLALVSTGIPRRQRRSGPATAGDSERIVIMITSARPSTSRQPGRAAPRQTPPAHYALQPLPLALPLPLPLPLSLPLPESEQEPELAPEPLEPPLLPDEEPLQWSGAPDLEAVADGLGA